jgi:hypothetical protein
MSGEAESTAATETCVICGESGCDAEMYDPATNEGGFCHYEPCAKDKGWVQA